MKPTRYFSSTSPLRSLFSVTGAGAIALFSLSVGTPLRAQVPVAPAAAATSKNCSLDVVESAGTGTKSTITQTYTYGSTMSAKLATSKLTITLRNMAPQPGNFTVEYYFVGKSLRNGGTFCYDKGSKAVPLGGGAFQDVVVESKSLESHTYRAGYDGHSNKMGEKPGGWIVLVKVGSAVVTTKTSSSQLDQLLSDKDAFDKFINDTSNRD